MSAPKAKRKLAARAPMTQRRSFSLTKRRLVDLVGDETLVNHEGLTTDPLDPLDIALCAMKAASQELQVLCHVTNLEAITSGDDLGMMLLRMSRRLDAAGDIAWQTAQADAEGSAK